MPESASISSWALNYLFTPTQNNVSSDLHMATVNTQKHGIYFCKSGNLCGAVLGHNESSSTYPLMTLAMQHPVIRPSFMSIADALQEEFANKR